MSYNAGLQKNTFIETVWGRSCILIEGNISLRFAPAVTPASWLRLAAMESNMKEWIEDLERAKPVSRDGEDGRETSSSPNIEDDELVLMRTFNIKFQRLNEICMNYKIFFPAGS